MRAGSILVGATTKVLAKRASQQSLCGGFLLLAMIQPCKDRATEVPDHGTTGEALLCLCYLGGLLALAFLLDWMSTPSHKSSGLTEKKNTQNTKTVSPTCCFSSKETWQKTPIAKKSVAQTQSSQKEIHSTGVPSKGSPCWLLLTPQMQSTETTTTKAHTCLSMGSTKHLQIQPEQYAPLAQDRPDRRRQSWRNSGHQPIYQPDYKQVTSTASE